METAQCIKCGVVNSADRRICRNCGCPITSNPTERKGEDKKRLGFKLRMMSAICFALAASLSIYPLLFSGKSLLSFWTPVLIAALFGFNTGAEILNPNKRVTFLSAIWKGIKTTGLSLITYTTILTGFPLKGTFDSFSVINIGAQIYFGWLLFPFGAAAGVVLFGVLRKGNPEFWIRHAEPITRSQSALMRVASVAVVGSLCIVVVQYYQYIAQIEVKRQIALSRLREAVEIGDAEALQALIERGSAPEFEEISDSLFDLAVFAGHLEIVKLMLTHGADPNRSGPDSEPPLAFAARDADLNMMQILVKAGADVNLPSGENEITPLMYAGPRNNIEIVKFLLENGASVNARNREGKTVLTLVKEQRERNDSVNENGTAMFPEELLSCDKMIVFLELHGAIE